MVESGPNGCNGGDPSNSKGSTRHLDASGRHVCFSYVPLHNMYAHSFFNIINDYLAVCKLHVVLPLARIGYTLRTV